MARFPDGFRWGFSTSAYQIEGAVNADGRGLSVWDIFCARPGAIADGESGRVACDHYHRWREDIGLMRDAGASAYRFSIAWPRVQPDGRGRPNGKGLDFYDRLVDALLEAGIAPYACLFHWDMPQPLEDRGGWSSRDTCYRFRDYAGIVAGRLGDRLAWAATLNEPSTLTWAGHAVGAHAPGHADRRRMLSALHHQNLAHGLAVATLRAEAPRLPLGILVNPMPARPQREEDGCVEAAEIFDDLWNRGVLDPLLTGRYPERLAEWLGPLVEDGDFAAIHQPLDRLGLNYFTRAYCRPDRDNPAGIAFDQHRPGDRKLTSLGWEMDGGGLYEVLTRLRTDYGNPAVTVTGNGAAFDDRPDGDGRVRDGARIDFYRDHLENLARAIADGANVGGYLTWSLLDNFELAAGYTQRLGTVFVDRRTLRRSPKDSHAFLRDVFQSNEIA